MIKKTIPLILTILVLVGFLSYAAFDRTKESDVSSIGNSNNNYVSESYKNNTIKISPNPQSGNLYKNTAYMTAGDTQAVKEQNISNEVKKADIDIFDYLNGLQCISYDLKSGETLTDIARKYESTCNLNSTIKMIKSISKIDDENNINSQTVVYIPEWTIKSGKMYKVSAGDTWYKVANEYYPKYTAESVMKLLVYINNLPNNDLPLGERIFLPVIS